jgi:hypothetical protein
MLDTMTPPNLIDLEFDLSPELLTHVLAHASCPYCALFDHPDWRQRLRETVSSIPFLTFTRGHPAPETKSCPGAERTGQPINRTQTTAEV